jgi:mRNA interferase RelE/StbE
VSERPTGRHPDATQVVVRLTEDAIGDLSRMVRADPQAVRWCLKKMLLLERNPEAGEPLVGDLIGFRKLTVGDRHWRVVWRVTHDETGSVVVDVAEMWAAGARSDGQVYAEMRRRIASLGASPQAQALAHVLDLLGRASQGLVAAGNPGGEPVPEWLVSRLVGKGADEAEIRALAPEAAMQRWEAIISLPRPSVLHRKLAG